MGILRAFLAGLILGIGLFSIALHADTLQPGFNQISIATITGRTRAYGIAMADFNSDGIPDIVCGDTYGDVHFYPGHGDGTFTDYGPASYVVNQAYHNAYGLAAADFNGDSHQDFVLTMRDNFSDADTIILSGEVHLYLGNGNGTFQSTGFPQEGLVVGDVGTASAAVTAGDVDGDGDMDIIASDITVSDNSRADIILFRNLGNDGSNQPLWSTGETLISAQDLGYSPNPELPPYFPPKSSSNIDAFGLALADMDGDADADLVVTDIASYIYIYRNDGTGSFSPIRYNTISTGTRPYAMVRAHETFTTQLAVACSDLNGDGLIDIVTGGGELTWEGKVDLWLNTGNDTNGWPRFLYAGIIGGAGTDARGLALGHINPSTDAFLDIVFGNYEAAISGLITDRADTDGDGIIDLYDNAPDHSNAPRLDMNDDGGINSLDQLDNDQDERGNPADTDDDNDGAEDVSDNSPYTANSDQIDTDGDGRGDASDPLNNNDTDSDGIFDGPIDPDLYVHAMNAKAKWSQSDTHFIVRIDALGRVFQNEFTQTMTDGAILSPAEWEVNKNYSYNGIGDDPATGGYQVPTDLPGGKEVPITLVVIPKKIWNAYGDTDPIRWINARLGNPNLEISQHGTYHADNTMKGDWAGNPNINWYSCETCGFTVEEMFEYLRIGQRTLLGNYTDWWIQDGGGDPVLSPKIDWSIAANPLISYAPPYNASDTLSREAVSHLNYVAFSASVYEENSTLFTPEGSHQGQFDQFGMFHASADLQVNPEYQGQMSYQQYLHNITNFGTLNTWLIEEVEWSSRYCNDLPRLEPCSSAPGGINRENNMVDLERWTKWMTLLDFVKQNGQPMTMGDYALAMAFDNAPTVANPDQADTDHNGIGDVIDGAQLTAENMQLQFTTPITPAVLTATLANALGGIANQTLTFYCDVDGDEVEEVLTAVTDANGVASIAIELTLPWGTVTSYRVAWDGLLITASTEQTITVAGDCPLMADLSGDCSVDTADLAILAAQWLDFGNPADCTLSADLAGNDCKVTLADFVILTQEWLMNY